MPIPAKAKMRGANMMRPKISNVHPKNLTKVFHLRKGDLVQVMRGKHEGAQGKIEEIIKKHDKVRVEGVALQVKHMKPNPFFPNG
jgi:large subunit ribosomal protein L24